MRSILFIFGIVALFFSSCNSNSSDNAANISNDTTDTLTIEYIDSTGSLEKFTEGILPYTVDSIALSDKNLVDEKILSSAFVLRVLKNQLKHVDGKNSEYYLKDFLHIDSCLQIMTEEEFNNTLDIGMMKTVTLYAGNFFILKNGNKAFTWYMKFSTYEACPYSAGIIMYCTILDKSGNQVSSIIIGESSGGGDAPYYSNTELYSVISNDYFISVKDTQVNGGDEEEGKTISETTKSEFKYQIVPETGEIKKISEKIGKPVKKFDQY